MEDRCAADLLVSMRVCQAEGTERCDRRGNMSSPAEKLESAERIKAAITEIAQELKRICPNAVLVTANEPFEDEDAILFAYVPNGELLYLQEHASRLATRVLTEREVDIAVLVRADELLKCITQEDTSRVVIQRRAS